MLVTFHSSAAPDVTMLKDLAQYLLGIVGKRIGERGVITCEELPAAIGRLEAAVAPDAVPDAGYPGARGALAPAGGVDAGAHPTGAVQRRRAYPFLDLLREARRQHADVMWGF